MAKIVIGIVLVVAGLSLLVASVWMLVDRSSMVFPEFGEDGNDVEKFGIAASSLTVIIGISCCFVKKAKVGKLLIFGAVCAAFVITISCFGFAVRDRLRFTAIDNALQEQWEKSRPITIGTNKNYLDKNIFSKAKTQLVVISVVSGIDASIQIAAATMIYLWSDT